MGDDTKPKTEKPQPLPHSKQLKWLTTIAILFGNITFGCAFNFYSPALEDLRAKYDTTVDDISFVFTIMLIAYCLGALSSGIVYNFINRQLGVIVCLGGMAFGLYATPHCESKTLFFMTGFVIGYFVGAYDATQVVWVIEIWQDKGGPFIQTQHFCYALGSNIPPLLLGPFLRDDIDEDSNGNSTTLSTTTYIPEEESKMYIPFSIGGALSTAACAFQLFLFIFYRYYVPPMYVGERKKSDDWDEEKIVESGPEDQKKSLEDLDRNANSTTELHKDSGEALEHKSGISGAISRIKTALFPINWSKFKLILITGVFLGAYQGMEMCTMQFIPQYGQYSDMKLSESAAATVLTGLTGGFALGRFLGIFIILKVPPVLMLFGNIFLIGVGNIILMFWANDDKTMFWAGCIIIGLGFSTIYACFSDFMEKNLIFTNAIGSFMLVCGSSVAAIYPVIVGNFIEDNVIVLTYTNFFSIVACTLSLGYGVVLTRNSNIRY